MDRCPDCGGSGVLRTDASGYRTCLACVGQGVLPRFETTGFRSALLAAAQPATDPLAGTPWRGEVSAWSSGG